MHTDPSKECPFCTRAELEVLREWPLVFAILDRYPVSEGHALLITRRHVPTWFDAIPEEQRALVDAVEPLRRAIEQRLDRPPDGWNVGFNVGEAAGQTVPHLHLHLIPRRHGDVPEPRGGVRGVIPERRNYVPIEEGT